MFQLRQSLLLLLTATIWGAGFVAQSIGMKYVTPYTYTFFRTLIGALFLLPVIYVLRHHEKCHGLAPHHQTQSLSPNAAQEKAQQRSDLLIGSLCCGACLVGGESFQQFGLQTTDAGKAGFITSIYIVFVPLVGLFLGKKINLSIAFGILIALVGLYLLCIKSGSLSMEHGDFLILMGAVLFTFHILVIDHFADRCNGVQLACGQFIAASSIAFVLMYSFDAAVFSWHQVYLAGLALLWSGIMSNGIAYTLQIVGQRGMSPTIATLILSLQSVMSAIFGAIILGERLSPRELTGCILLFIAVILAQMHPKMILATISKHHAFASLSHHATSSSTSSATSSNTSNTTDVTATTATATTATATTAATATTDATANTSAVLSANSAYAVPHTAPTSAESPQHHTA